MNSTSLRVLLCATVALLVDCSTDSTSPRTRRAVAKVVVSPDSVAVQVGWTVQLEATPEDATGMPFTGEAITWSTSDGAVASVDNSGTVTARGPGLATVTATAQGQSGSAKVLVNPPPPPTVATVTVSPESAAVVVGAQVKLSATLKDAGGNPLTGRSVTWGSSDGAVASVDDSGLVTGIGPGSATVFATADGKSGAATVTVSPPPPPPSVATVAVAPASATILVGGEVQLTATPKDAAGNPLSGRVVTWSSSAGAIASVDDNGAVTGQGPGTATITAAAEGKSGTATIDVTLPPPPPVATVKVVPESAAVLVDDTVRLVATLEDAGGNPLSGRVVTWSSSDGTIASVSDGGLVTGEGPGAATVTATAEGKSGAATITVTVPPPAPVATVTVAPDPATVLVGDTVRLVATPKDADGNPLAGRVVTWSSGDGGIASVDDSGLVTGEGVGTTTVTATAEGQSGSASVTVDPRPPIPVATVAVEPESAAVFVGDTVRLVATPKDAAGNPLAGRTVSWGTTDGAVASVTDSGLVTGQAPGTATVTATVEGKTGATAISVDPQPVATVTVAPGSATVVVSDTVRLVATPKDAGGNPLTGRVVAWTSSDETIAAVDDSGLVTGEGPGTATATATVEGKTGSATITVNPPPVVTMSVTPESAAVVVGDSLRLVATPQDALGNPLTGRVITWGTSDGVIAAVNDSGLVTGLMPGTATVTATAEGKTGTAAITILAVPPSGTATCLSQAGPTVTLSGLQTSPYDNTSLANTTKIDASTAQFLTSATISIRIGGGAGLCWHGAESIGQLPPSTSWSTALSYYAAVPDGPNVTVEDIRTFDRGDGVAFGTNVPNFVLRRAYIRYARDGCVENHFVFSGTVEDALLDGCFIGFASRPYTTTQDGSNNVLTIRNVLVRLQPMDGVYTGPTPGNGGFYEWSAISPKVSIHNSVFRADQNTNNGDEDMAPPPGKLADCSNNVMIWLGPGPFPEPLPSCFRVLTGAEGLQYWNTAVAQWKAAHPTLLTDVGPPVVSLFSPSRSTTLSGTVTLTATAVDERVLAGVQFKLNGQNIGAEVTTEAPLTKYTLTWDSHGKPNGTYTLTAVARDAVGHTTTSAGVSVTISN